MNRREVFSWAMAAAIAGLGSGCNGSDSNSDASNGDPPMLKFSSVTSTDGVHLNVVETGNPQGPPIVFVHGISQSWLSWIAVMADPALRSKYRLVAFDLRGHGASQGSQVAVNSEGTPFAALPDASYNDGNAGRTAALWASDLQAVLEGLNLSSPAVVGWSYGGAVLLDYIGLRAGLGGVGKAIWLASSPVLLPPGTVDGGADTVFSPSTFGALVTTMPINPATGQANSHGVIAAGLSAFVELCYQDELGRSAPGAARVQASTGFNLFTPAAVRLAIIGRAYDYRAALRALNVADKARLRVIVPMGDKVLQPAATLAYWTSTGLAVDTLAGEGHLYHDRNTAGFAKQLAVLAG